MRHLVWVSLVAVACVGPSSSLVGPGGGVVEGEGVLLSFPAGALETEVEITIERVAVPSGYAASGDVAYRFRPEGLVFRAPVTVRFAVSSGEEDATVYWSRAGSAELDALPTHLEGNDAVASIEHFSLGFAGWLDAGSLDGGSLDGGSPDAGLVDGGADASDDADLDASDDAGSDGGLEDDGGVVTGVTCVVDDRSSSCAAAPVTYTDVPFELLPVGQPPSYIPGLRSPLGAFRTLYGSTDSPLFTGDAEGRAYVVGGDGIPNITRRAMRIDVDVHVMRAGLGCPGGEPRIRIDCTGSTLVSALECRSAYPLDRAPLDPEPPALSCTVRRRDASCVSVAPTTEVPTAWLAPGWHSAESEIGLRSPALVEATGGDLRGYQEHPCGSYLVGSEVVLRRGAEFWIESLRRSSSASCVDGLGTRRALLEVTCSGAGILSAPP